MQNAEFFFKYKLHQLIIWMLIFGLWFFLRYEDYALESTAFKVTLVKVADLAVMVYLTNYLLIPQLLYKRRYFLFAVAFLVMIVVSSVIKMNILGHLLNNAALLNFSGNLKARIYDNVIPHFFLVLAGAAIKLMVDHTRMQQRMVEMAKEKAEAELNFLKSQINPHFLFNSLNSVYFLIEKQNSEARDALHKFSAMLRYQLYEMNGKAIFIEKEISYLRDYIDLQKLRKEENFSVELNSSPGLSGICIEPLLLIPFVENAFKHISHHTGRPNYIRIDALVKDGWFHFNIENSKDVQESSKDGHAGIGLANVQRRLELLYPGRHQLKISNGIDTFAANLSIKI
jgi:two-component system, LytTR family, sensor kinase